MSLFLGKIHFWLYNKILWAESLEQEIINKAKITDNDVEDLVKYINNQFGEPIGKRPLEEIIDTSNIHGSLQQMIESVELRIASLITELLNRNPAFRDELVKIYINQGETAAKELVPNVADPEEIFNAINEFILEGMPCDRVNEVVVSDSSEFAWKTTRCLHMHYWMRIGGDVQNFYDLRETWIKAFVKTLNNEFEYEKNKNGINRIVRLK